MKDSCPEMTTVQISIYINRTLSPRSVTYYSADKAKFKCTLWIFKYQLVNSKNARVLLIFYCFFYKRLCTMHFWICKRKEPNYKHKHQQERISVGCVPAAHGPYAGVCFPGGVCWGGGLLPGGLLLPGVCSWGGVCSRGWRCLLLGGGVCSKGVVS